VRRSLYIALAVFCLSFWLWRLPFILWLPLLEFGPDSFDYFALVKAFQDNAAVSYPVDLPLGFPVFVYLVKLISDKAMFIVWLQFLAKFMAGATLIYVCWKHYKRIAVAVAVVLSIYVTDSWSLRYDTTLIPDSLYNSILLFVIAFFIQSFKTPSPLSLAALSASMFLAAFFRPNGFFVYFLIPVMLILFLPHGKRALKCAYLTIPALILHLAAFGFKSHSGILRPHDDRINVILNQQKEALTTSSGKSYCTRKWTMAKEYFAMLDFPSFYFSLLPERYHQLYELDNVHNPDYKMFDWTTPVPDDLRRLVYSEYYYRQERVEANRMMMDVTYAYSHPLFLMIHLAYKIQNILFRNLFWYLLGMALFTAGLWIYCGSRFANKEALLLSLLLAAHFISLLIVIIGHSRMQFRYAHVTEFLLYLAPVFFTAALLSSFRGKNHAP